MEERLEELLTTLREIRDCAGVEYPGEHLDHIYRLANDALAADEKVRVLALEPRR